MSVCKNSLIKIGLFSVVMVVMVGCNSGSSATPTNSTSYQMVLDAGSSGTRVFVYQIQAYL